MKPTLESLTSQERLKLANAARLAAMGIALMWDALREIGKRHGSSPMVNPSDWEPEMLSCSVIADELASSTRDFVTGAGNPEDVLAVPESTILDYFFDPADWQEGE